MTTPLLEFKNVTIDVPPTDEDHHRGRVTLVDDVSFSVNAGEMYALVGESGSGKTVSSLAALGFLPQPGGRITQGSILFNGHDIHKASPKELMNIRGKEISMIFQEPGASLNPIMRVKKQLLEVFSYHAYEGDPEKRILDLMKRVGFNDPERVLNSFPHELSGGMQQRIMIAMALLLKPALIIADEPTTALDVTVQKQIMELIIELQAEEKSAILFITHNLALVSQYADRLSVMQKGRIVESGTIDQFFAQPKEEYSRELLAAIPRL